MPLPPGTPAIHQIWLGDSIDLCDRFKPGKVDCVITDPPFGVDNQSNSSVTVEGRANATKILNDETPEIAIKIFNQVMDVLLPKTADNSDLYIFTAGAVLKEWLDVSDSLERHGYTRKGVLVWAKDGPGMGDLDSWGQAHEYIVFLKKGRRKGTDTRRSGVLHVPQLRPNKLIHPHEKPTGVLEPLIKHSTSKGDFLVDPFGGSGSLVRAARLLGRSCVAIEKDPERHKKSVRKLNTDEGEGMFGDE